MYHAVFAGHQIYKGTKGLDADDFAKEDFADLDFTRERFDHADSLLGGLAIGGGHKHAPIVFDVHRGTGSLDDATDSLATGANQGADFVNRNLQGDDAWR